MGYGVDVQVSCTNKLCDYEGFVILWNTSIFSEKHVCPSCGFKTLDERWKSQMLTSEPSLISDEEKNLLQNYIDIWWDNVYS